MARLGMDGSYDFNLDSINSIITETKPGNYALGYKKDSTFFVQYVGRADSDLNDRIIDNLSKNKYKRFKYSYATSAKAAFEKECQNYHDFGGKEKLDNRIHPDSPDGINRNHIVEDITVFYMLSDNYYESPYCLNEMGAAWIALNDFSIFLLPNFSGDIRGVIDCNKKGYSLNVAHDLISLKDKLVKDLT